MISRLWIILNGYVGDEGEMDLSFFSADWLLLRTNLLIFDKKRPRILLFRLFSIDLALPWPGLQSEGP